MPEMFSIAAQVDKILDALAKAGADAALLKR